MRGREPTRGSVQHAALEDEQLVSEVQPKPTRLPRGKVSIKLPTTGNADSTPVTRPSCRTKWSISNRFLQQTRGDTYGEERVAAAGSARAGGAAPGSLGRGGGDRKKGEGEDGGNGELHGC